MTKEQESKKNFVDPALASSIGFFAFKSVAQAVVGWIGLEAVKSGWEKSKNWFGGKNGSSDPQRVSQEKSTEKT